MRLPAILTTAIILVVPLASTAADLPVNYLVEAKPFKKSVSAGDHDTEV